MTITWLIDNRPACNFIGRTGHTLVWFIETRTIGMISTTFVTTEKFVWTTSKGDRIAFWRRYNRCGVVPQIQASNTSTIISTSNKEEANHKKKNHIGRVRDLVGDLRCLRIVSIINRAIADFLLHGFFEGVKNGRHAVMLLGCCAVVVLLLLFIFVWVNIYSLVTIIVVCTVFYAHIVRDMKPSIQITTRKSFRVCFN